MKVVNKSEAGWTLVRETTARGSARKLRGIPETEVLRPSFLPPGSEIAEVHLAMMNAGTGARRGAPLPLEVDVEPAAGESVVLVVRDVGSSALTFHAPLSRTRSGTKAGEVVRFRIQPHEGGAARRGLVTKALKLIVVKVKDLLVGKLEEAAFALAGRAAEALWWRRKELAEGLFRVTSSAAGIKLSPTRGSEVATGRSLLLLHGTFSSTASAFGGLASNEVRFFEAARAVYGDRIYALEHFTVSRTPEENAAALLKALPERTTTFDVITHSRGGLVLRTLTEGTGLPTELTRRFSLGRAVLVACPNQGTPLATPRRWDETLGLIANLIEMLPTNPWTTGADFVASGLLWLAKHITADLPGVASMDVDGDTIADLQSGSGPQAGTYWALGANFHPEASWVQRLADAGVDRFFAGANDLVVPTEGSWLVDGAGIVVPSSRIACFGPGGNLGQPTASSVNHVNFFDQKDTSRFLLHALDIRSLPLAALDPNSLLPIRRLFRGGAGLAVPRAANDGRRLAPSLEALRSRSAVTLDDAYATDMLHLMILSSEAATSARSPTEAARPTDPVLLATYGSARVLEPLPVRNGPRETSTAGTRFHDIIAVHERIRDALDGKIDPKTNGMPELPDDRALCSFGTDLFEALFVGGVRRLYDVARSEQRGRPLNIVLTCTVPWLAALPWEFAFDPSRRKFLVTEEVHFLRNVLTAVPAQRIAPRAAPLRILFVAAQPKGAGGLSLDEEEARMKESFRTLIDAGLVEVDVLLDATPTALHDRILDRGLAQHPYDVVHFGGHGRFDEKANEGKLLFVGTNGGAQEVDVRTLREILCDRGIHLVFLNACDSARGGAKERHTANRGVAQALVEGGMPGVVANQYKVLDSAAVSFSERFYWSLALGASLGEAAREARIAVNYSIDGEAIDWAVPVLHARDPSVRLCAPAAAEPPMVRRPSGLPRGLPTHNSATRSTSTREDGPIRVGIADTEHFFADLDQILATINSAQSRIVLEPAKVTVPLGVWAVHHDDEGRRVRYLFADRFAAKLAKRPLALGVDYLVCISGHPMRDAQTINIYGWWSGTEEVPVLLFSTWDLGLPSNGTLAGRAVANGIVESLAAQLAQAYDGTELVHKHGATACPFHYNETRDVKHIAGALRIDDRCREKLSKHLPPSMDPPSLLAAFDAILGAFEGDPSEASR